MFVILSIFFNLGLSCFTASMLSWLEKSELENAQWLLTIIAKKQYVSLKLLTLWPNPVP